MTGDRAGEHAGGYLWPCVRCGLWNALCEGGLCFACWSENDDD